MEGAMSKLWAPWRSEYFSRHRKPVSSPKKCIFCLRQRKTDDSKDHLLSRGRLVFSLLNRYPYNNGHLMVAPYRHVGRLPQLRPQEWAEMLELANDAMARLDRVMKPAGYNVGINLGRAAGAGIPGHLYLHIVPRWVGDTNFITTVAGIKVISQSLDASHHLLKGAGKNRHKKKV